ncbi:hypothetical protein GWK47_014984 [Chionoecetes opilio]|uniref:Uncharacterized protein n=1 Tax=Chionoecetes opilio TaxID=41210 RepID=A0A8J5C029_CHIOP|nr:hypothetical protein GWK47_014984 [Chionoecetes opilio]
MGRLLDGKMQLSFVDIARLPTDAVPAPETRRRAYRGSTTNGRMVNVPPNPALVVPEPVAAPTTCVTRCTGATSTRVPWNHCLPAELPRLRWRTFPSDVNVQIHEL